MMRIRLLVGLLALLAVTEVLRAQTTTEPDGMVIDTAFTRQITAIVHDLALDRDYDVGEDGIEQISLAVVDLRSDPPRLGGYHWENFIYPASVYKMYVAAEVLDQISRGEYSLLTPFVVKSPNDVDRSRELDWDPRPLLRDGDTVTVGYLLDLMITRSDNSAANCLIDRARRERINALMHRYHWEGSEVTRKFLKRKFEDSAYVSVRGTETCALHAAEFMMRIRQRTLVNPWVSMELESYLGRQLDTTKLSTGLPPGAMFYHKTGWFSYWTNDVGIVDDGTVRYVISCFLPIPEDQARPKMQELSRRVFDLLKGR